VGGDWEERGREMGIRRKLEGYKGKWKSHCRLRGKVKDKY